MLSDKALRGIASEFVTREGTDYGHQSWDMETKIEQVLAQIERGEVVILADPETGSCNLMRAEDYERDRRDE
jgi:hypothetical protein